MAPVALVTGALGGVGKATCEVLESYGYQVIKVDLRQPSHQLKGFLKFDIATLHRPDARAAFKEQVEDLLDGPLELIVNNAALQVVKPLSTLTVEECDATYQTNVLAPLILMQLFEERLKESSGLAVNIASIHANLTKANFVAYATSKGALVTMTRAIALDWEHTGARVAAILPAALDTPMLRAGFEGNQEGYDRLGAFHPIGRIGMPEEVGELIVHLAKGGSATNGAIIEIDGGIGGRLAGRE